MNDAAPGRYRRVLGEGAWVAAGQAASVAGTLLGTRLLTQIVPPEAFGRVALLLGAAVLLKNFTFMPLAQAGTQFHAELAAAGGVGLLRRVLQRGLRWSWIGAALGLAAGLAWSLHSGLSAWSPPLVAALFILDVRRGLEVTFLGAARRQRAASLWAIGETWLRPGFAIASALLLGPTADAVLLGYAVASALLLLAFLLRGSPEGAGDRGEPVPGWAEERLTGEVRAFAAPMVPLAAILWANSIGDRYVLGWLRSPADVGVYAAAWGLTVTPFNMAQGVVTQTLRPVFLQGLAARNPIHARRAFTSWLGGTVAICAAGFAAFLVLKGPVALVLLAPEYRPGESLMPWIAGGAAIQATGQVLALRLISLKRTRAWALSETIGCVLSIPVMILMVRWKGGLGAAMAYPINAAAVLLVQAGLNLLGPCGTPAPPALPAAEGHD